MKFIVISALLLSQLKAFSSLSGHTRTSVVSSEQAEGQRRHSALFMGRAAAVRASTKSKTDAKKAKTNAVFGKRIIMAVKQGGSPDPTANRMLGDIIKQAKANNVPVDVRQIGLLPMLQCTLPLVPQSQPISVLSFFSAKNINRVIKRATEGNAGDFSESTFEAYGFGGASLGKKETVGSP